MNERSSVVVDQALKAQMNIKNEDGVVYSKMRQNQINKNFTDKEGKNSKNSSRQGPQGTESHWKKSNIQCHQCKKQGHY